ncbi:TPA_asm: hypothetical protein GI696_03975 [Listeria monocytogenes]|nr:hypothetical protein [Listeria monocytogenes]
MTKIYSNNQIFQLAYKDGWVGLIGTQINIQGIDFSFCQLRENDKLRIKISEVNSGALILAVTVDIINAFILDTKEKLFAFYESELVPLIEAIIKENGIEKIREETEKVKKQMIKKFGDMPIRKLIGGN